jgi:hypothetical protein
MEIIKLFVLRVRIEMRGERGMQSVCLFEDDALLHNKIDLIQN